MIDELKVLIPEHTHDAINMIVIVPNRAYMLIFTPSDRGQFSTKEFTKINRTCAQSRLNMGATDMEPSLSAKYWRFSLEINATCFSRGYSHSNSRYYVSVSVSMLQESLPYLFIHSEVARAI